MVILMASRMDRYRIEEGRSVRNQDIYKQLEELGTYTNIEGIANIEDSNEIDISKIKEMLNNRENYQKQKKYKELLNNDEKAENFQKDIEEIEKKYDIKDVLSDALKNRNVMDNDNHKFELSKYDIIKELIDKKNKEAQKEDLSDNLLESLIGDKTENDKTIKQVIEEAKNDQQQEEDMDKSFFTNSLSLTGSDFENLKEIHTDIKKNNTLLKIISFIVIVAVVSVLVVLLLK
jgi:hypothetical protein